MPRRRVEERRRARSSTPADHGDVVGTVIASLPGTELEWPLDALLEEVSTSINTTAAGGNASLMMIG